MKVKKEGYAQIKTEIPKEYMVRLDEIVEKYHFRSRYQLLQYLVKSFVKVADPQPTDEVVPADIEEMFEGFQTPSKREFQDIKRGAAI
jgi:metal-responsive CopG/Arc/MetJ family transcriptional regulator